MDADERLMALKKAYADIILNTAKEAAARIMVSERKALRFQQELNVTKEQALQMLLRLKQVMDSKVSEADMTNLNQQRKIEELEGQLRGTKDTISEAEATSFSQQRKIEELEAQLQEGEDIVKDLREELREVQAELERVRNKKSQHIGERDTAIQEQTSQENRLHTSQSIIFPPPTSQIESFTTPDMKNSAFNQGNEVYKCYNANDYRLGNSYSGKPDLPSTSEENGLNTSQSIIFPPPESQLESFKASDMKSSAFNQRKEVYKYHSANDFRMGNSYVGKPNLPSIILRSKEPELYRNRRIQRIHAFEEKLMAGELSFSETVDDVNYESSREDGEGEGIYKTPAYKTNNMCSTEEKDAVHADCSWQQVQKVNSFRRKRRRATRYTKNKKPSSRYLSNLVLRSNQTSHSSCKEATSVNNNAQSGGDLSNMAPRFSTDTKVNGTLVGCTKVTESDAEFVNAGSFQNTLNKDIDKILLIRPESGSVEISGVPFCRMDVPVIKSETKTSASLNGIPNQPVTERVIKYTFQRKRKKESLSGSDGNASLEKSILKKKMAEKQNGPLEMEKSSSITESSRHSRRLAQVAHQLISLSQKKWRQ